LNKLTILITGVNGLLGQYLLKALAGHDVSVVAVSKGPSRVGDLIHEGVIYRELDITDGLATDILVEEYNPDIIIHAAAMTQADDCELNKVSCWNNNVTATRFLVDAAKKINSFFIYVSTDFVFDGKEGPYGEDAIPEPVNYYGSSKLAAEKAVIESPISSAIVRTVLVYGKTADGTRTNIITWVKKELEQGKKIRVVDDQIRTPTYAGDLANAIIQIGLQKAKGIWHISGAETFTPFQMAVIVAKELQLDLSLIERTDASEFKQPAIRPLRTGFIIDKAVREISYRPISFKEGIYKMIGGKG